MLNLTWKFCNWCVQCILLWFGYACWDVVCSPVCHYPLTSACHICMPKILHSTLCSYYHRWYPTPLIGLRVQHQWADTPLALVYSMYIQIWCDTSVVDSKNCKSQDTYHSGKQQSVTDSWWQKIGSTFRQSNGNHRKYLACKDEWGWLPVLTCTDESQANRSHCMWQVISESGIYCGDQHVCNVGLQ